MSQQNGAALPVPPSPELDMDLISALADSLDFENIHPDLVEAEKLVASPNFIQKLMDAPKELDNLLSFHGVHVEEANMLSELEIPLAPAPSLAQQGIPQVQPTVTQATIQGTEMPSIRIVRHMAVQTTSSVGTQTSPGLLQPGTKRPAAASPALPASKPKQKLQPKFQNGQLLDDDIFSPVLAGPKTAGRTSKPRSLQQRPGQGANGSGSAAAAPSAGKRKHADSSNGDDSRQQQPVSVKKFKPASGAAARNMAAKAAAARAAAPSQSVGETLGESYASAHISSQQKGSKGQPVLAIKRRGRPKAAAATAAAAAGAGDTKPPSRGTKILGMALDGPATAQKASSKPKSSSLTPTLKAKTTKGSVARVKDYDGYEDALCNICGQGEPQATMLLCDGCDKGFHTTCCVPPLGHIPKGDWFCAVCEKERAALLHEIPSIPAPATVPPPAAAAAFLAGPSSEQQQQIKSKGPNVPAAVKKQKEPAAAPPRKYKKRAPKADPDPDYTPVSRADAGRLSHRPLPEGMLQRTRRAELQVLVHLSDGDLHYEREMRKAYGDTPDLGKAVRNLAANNMIERASGDGTKRDPSRYRILPDGQRDMQKYKLLLEADALACKEEAGKQLDVKLKEAEVAYMARKAARGGGSAWQDGDDVGADAGGGTAGGGIGILAIKPENQ